MAKTEDMMTCDNLGTKRLYDGLLSVRRCRRGSYDRLKKVLGVYRGRVGSSDLEDCDRSVAGEIQEECREGADELSKEVWL